MRFGPFACSAGWEMMSRNWEEPLENLVLQQFPETPLGRQKGPRQD
jgi:hypothetical protein